MGGVLLRAAHRRSVVVPAPVPRLRLGCDLSAAPGGLDLSRVRDLLHQLLLKELWSKSQLDWSLPPGHAAGIPAWPNVLLLVTVPGTGPRAVLTPRRRGSGTRS
jgi:hypothetical protein